MQPGSALLETLGFIAAILTTLSFLPQALRIRRLGSADDVSLTMYLMMVTGQGLWLIYAIVIVSPSMIGANVVSMSFVIWVLAMKLRHLRRMRAMPPLSAAATAPAE
jgi:MtN3 and saliva related transmembrane protein